MADITSGTVRATPLGDFWIGTLEHAAASCGDVIGLEPLLGTKIQGVLFASDNSGTANGVVNITVSSTSGSVTTVSSGGTRLFFVAQSKKE